MPRVASAVASRMRFANSHELSHHCCGVLILRVRPAFVCALPAFRLGDIHFPTNSERWTPHSGVGPRWPHGPAGMTRVPLRPKTSKKARSSSPNGMKLCDGMEGWVRLDRRQVQKLPRDAKSLFLPLRARHGLRPDPRSGGHQLCDGPRTTSSTTRATRTCATTPRAMSLRRAISAKARKSSSTTAASS